MPRYRKRPVVIQAVRWDGSNTAEVAAMFARDLKAITPLGRSGEQLAVRTLEGTMTANRGDWIVCGLRGEPYPVKDDIFEASYEPVSDEVS